MKKYIILLISTLCFLFILLLTPPAHMNPATWRMIGITFYVVTLWVTEALPLPITSLLPILLMPLLGIMLPAKATTSYGAPMIYLLLGGFLFAAALKKWHLHKRFAYTLLKWFGNSPRGMVLAFMLVCGFLSMWISNGAVALMITPIGVAFIGTILNADPEKPEETSHPANDPQRFRFSKSILYTIAVGSTIGGMATIIGTPPNALMAGMLSSLFKVDITFFDWLKIGLPIVLMLLFISWLIITRLFFNTGTLKLPEAGEICKKELAQMGRMTLPEKRTLLLFASTAFLWMICGTLNAPLNRYVSDTSIAIFGGVLLFIIPSGLSKNEKLLDWDSAKELPWGVLLLVGGGISLAHGFETSGLNQYVRSELVGIDIKSPFLFIALCTFLAVVITQFAPNMAVATLMIPIMGVASGIIGLPPQVAIMPVVLGASLSFTMPVGTPPNAIVYGQEILKQSDMIRAGSIISLISWIVVMGVCYLLTFPK